MKTQTGPPAGVAAFVGRERERAKVADLVAWTTLGGYLRGVALLGVVEGAVIGLALTLVGAKLAVPVAVLTFMAAFVPLVGAVFAGAVAVLVALATAGVDGAVIILAVAVLVQQLDNDLLAPVVYGRALNLHPVVVLLAITTGGALFGLLGSFLAVPFTAVVVNMVAAGKNHQAGIPDDISGNPHRGTTDPPGCGRVPSRGTSAPVATIRIVAAVDTASNGGSAPGFGYEGET